MMDSIKIFQTVKRIVMGCGSIKRIADEMKRLGCKKVMVITDPGLVRTGIVGQIEDLLDKGGISVTRFDEV